MRHFSLLLVLSVATGAFGFRSVQFEERLAGIESQTHVDECQIRALQTKLAEARAEAARSELAIEALERKHDEALATGRNLEVANASFENALTATRQTIEAHADKLKAFESTVATPISEAWEEPLHNLQETIEEKWNHFGDGVQRTQGLALQNREQLEQLDRKLNRDVESMWRELMGPTVQLSGETTVGSGVLLESVPDGDGYKTYVLTAWHVVRDILADADMLDGPIPITMYSPEGAKTRFDAELLRFDPGIDSALLALDSTEAVPFGAKLASRDELAAISIFSNIYAAGCPLGNDPIPTFGELADTRHVVDDDLYWMVSAPTYVGNSGGGIFDAESRKLIGIFSKIYTHGTLRPTVVPHMGLSTPLSVVYDWLDGEGYGQIIPGNEPAIATAASAPVGE